MIDGMRPLCCLVVLLVPVALVAAEGAAAALWSARYARAMRVAPLLDVPTDRAILRIGELDVDVLATAGERVRFDPDALRGLTAEYREPGIRCLCLPRPWGALALYDQWEEHVGWVLFNRNHNGFELRDAGGMVLASYRFQRSGPTEGVFSDMIATADVDAIAAGYGLVRGQRP